MLIRYIASNQIKFLIKIYKNTWKIQANDAGLYECWPCPLLSFYFYIAFSVWNIIENLTAKILTITFLSVRKKFKVCKSVVKHEDIICEFHKCRNE